jgi:hypothetical protein
MLLGLSHRLYRKFDRLVSDGAHELVIGGINVLADTLEHSLSKTKGAITIFKPINLTNLLGR